ncbi:hypothetical protein AB0758_44885 [Tolypothrix bouteillei VB521301_2]
MVPWDIQNLDSLLSEQLQEIRPLTRTGEILYQQVGSVIEEIFIHIGRGE